MKLNRWRGGRFASAHDLGVLQPPLMVDDPVDFLDFLKDFPGRNESVRSKLEEVLNKASSHAGNLIPEEPVVAHVELGWGHGHPCPIVDTLDEPLKWISSRSSNWVLWEVTVSQP